MEQKLDVKGAEIIHEFPFFFVIIFSCHVGLCYYLANVESLEGWIVDVEASIVVD